MRQAANDLKLSEAKESTSSGFTEYWWGLIKLFCFAPGLINWSLLKVYEGNKRCPGVIQRLPLSGAYFVNRIQLFQEKLHKIKHTPLVFPWVNMCLWGEQLCTVSGSCVRSGKAVGMTWPEVPLKVIPMEEVTWLSSIIIETFFFGLCFGNNKAILDWIFKSKKPHISQHHQQPKATSANIPKNQRIK